MRFFLRTSKRRKQSLCDGRRAAHRAHWRLVLAEQRSSTPLTPVSVGRLPTASLGPPPQPRPGSLERSRVCGNGQGLESRVVDGPRRDASHARLPATCAGDAKAAGATAAFAGRRWAQVLGQRASSQREALETERRRGCRPPESERCGKRPRARQNGSKTAGRERRKRTIGNTGHDFN